jgi:hypothetical protein
MLYIYTAMSQARVYTECLVLESSFHVGLPVDDHTMRHRAPIAVDHSDLLTRFDWDRPIAVVALGVAVVVLCGGVLGVIGIAPVYIVLLKGVEVEHEHVTWSILCRHKQHMMQQYRYINKECGIKSYSIL